MDTTVTVAIIGLIGGTIGGITTGFFATLRFFKEEKSEREKRIDDREVKFWARVDEREADYERQIAELKTHYEAQLASLRASMVELQHTVDKQAERISLLEDENGRLQAENHRLKSGKGSKI